MVQLSWLNPDAGNAHARQLSEPRFLGLGDFWMRDSQKSEVTLVENPDNPKILKILILTMYTRGNCLNHDFWD
ncbi:hypothetical protein [Runella sp.]|uniref:hypothetical protein n=1 Tax=Runella sp. TaxID=1960881 RepID=UPI003019BBCF